MPGPKRTSPATPSIVDGTGRVYLPKNVRDALGIGPDGGHVAFEVKGGVVTVRAVAWVPK